MTQTLHAHDVTAEDLRHARSAMNQLPDGSPLALLLEGALAAMQRGEDVTFVTSGRELSTSEVAALLNVSRPHVTKLMKLGVLESHLVGSHHRTTLEAVHDYIARREAASRDLARAAGAPSVVHRERMERAIPLDDAAAAELRALGFGD